MGNGVHYDDGGRIMKIGYVNWNDGYWVFKVKNKSAQRVDLCAAYKDALKAGCPREHAKALVRKSMLLASRVEDREFVSKYLDDGGRNGA
jgi:hypothetical protein